MDEPILDTPEIVHLCHAIQHLWMAANAMSYIDGGDAASLHERLVAMRLELYSLFRAKSSEEGN